MLGTDLAEAFKTDNPVLLDKDDVDIADEAAIQELLRRERPELVINAAAYTAVDDAESNQELAMAVNGTAVGHIAKAAHEQGAVVVHYSTDYIFDGENQQGYDEDDKPADTPLNVYGASKLLGEQELVKNTPNYYLIRTSWLFGKNGKNFPATMVRLAGERDELNVINDQHGKPTYTKDLAKATYDLTHGEYDFGIYHITNEEATTWFDIANEAIAAYGKANNWPKDRYPKVSPIATEQYPTPAKRPHWSILNNTKFPPLRSWKEALKEYIEEIV